MAKPLKPPKPEPTVLDLRTALEWEQWLEQHADETPEGVWLRLLNKNAPETRFSYLEAVEIAVCFGWIDGQARKHDEISRLQKFTPRRARSAWSKVNTERAERLAAEGRMRPSGQREIDAARADGRWRQAYAPPSEATIPDDFLAELRKNEKAAAFFATLDKRNTFPVSYRLATAKKPETRAKRIKAMIEMFERREKFYD